MLFSYKTQELWVSINEWDKQKNVRPSEEDGLSFRSVRGAMQEVHQLSRKEHWHHYQCPWHWWCLGVRFTSPEWAESLPFWANGLYEAPFQMERLRKRWPNAIPKVISTHKWQGLSKPKATKCSTFPLKLREGKWLVQVHKTLEGLVCELRASFFWLSSSYALPVGWE